MNMKAIISDRKRGINMEEIKKRILYPKPLKAGNQICLIDPANAYTEEAIEAVSSYWKGRGFQVICAPEMAFKRGTPKERAAKLNKVFADEENKAVMCIWGGYGTMTLLDYLDYEMIRERKPVFTGFSDITALHLAIGQKTGLVTFHGGAVYGRTRTITEDAKEAVYQSVTTPVRGKAFSNFNGEPFHIYKEGIGEGILTGGNLTLLSRLTGTPYEVNTREKILFFEEIGEKPYRLHGMLTQLKMAGKFEEVKGIIVGDLSGCDTKDRPGTALEAVKEVLEDVKCPVIYGVRAGHIGDSMTLPLHAQVRIEAVEEYGVQFRAI